MTSPACSTCKRPCVAGLSFVQFVAKRWCMWRLCFPCFQKEQER